MGAANIFSAVPQRLPKELFETIVRTKTCIIERILSRGQSSAEDFWYDQEQNEWVILLKGRAVLEFEDAGDTVELGPGDYVNIPAHRKHRVAWTDPVEVSIWVAVHY